MSQLQTQPINRLTVQKLLSTCQRCRRLRRKCDTLLPACRLCQKAEAECMMFDHALQQALPRSYVQSLLTRLERLQVMKDAVSNSDPNAATAAQPTIDSSSQSDNVSSVSSPPVDPLISPEPSFDIHFYLQSGSEDTFRFFGSSSVFALTVEVVSHTYSKGFTINSSNLGLSETQIAQSGKEYFPRTGISAVEDMRSLVALYFTSINTLYGFLDASTAESDLNSYLELRSYESLQGYHAHQYFRISMICAIACANQSRYRPTRAAESMAFYADALTCVEEVTSEVSPASLQALLLLVLFCLFHPRKGDIWKLLDYACRLSIELGYHTEPAIGLENEPQCKLRRSTFWGLYAIERIVGQLFGRGSDLPETIITTEYPSAIDAALFADQASFQPVSIAHHYRLVYLRSEIYRDLYLPVTLPDFDLSWYKERHATLLAWKKELEVTDDLTGVATVTCDVGFCATMCFLFQPLMLRALWKTAEPVTDNETLERLASVPQDNYWAACELIRMYERVMRAPQDSPLGAYPMTFMSAHYIYLAGLTLMAHCLLALDGRTMTLRPFAEEVELSNPQNHPIVFEDISEVAGSCLLLLGWCTDKFPGMGGMLSVFKKLSDKLVPALIRKGLA